MERRLTGRTVLMILLAVFGVVFAVNGIFIAEAVTTFRGGDEQSPYLQGLEYNRTLAHRTEQAKRGWRAAIAFDRTGADAKVTVILRTHAGAPIAGERLFGDLRHPADAARDRIFVLAQENPGTYSAIVPRVARGAWDVGVHSKSRVTPFEASRRIWLP